MAEGIRSKARAFLKAVYYGAGGGATGAVAGVFLGGGLNAMGIPVDPITAGIILGGISGGLAMLVGLIEDWLS